MKNLARAGTLVRRLWTGAAKRARISMQLVLAVVREIFDESAYARFLARRNLRSTSTTYAAFLRETEAARIRRPRCC